MRPARDPNCQRYIEDPGYVWSAGQWHTRAGIEARRARGRRYSKAYNRTPRGKLMRYFSGVRGNIKRKRERVEADAAKLGVDTPWQMN